MPVTSWSTTASANDTADSASGIVFSENQPPAQLNDSCRGMMAVIKGDFANSLSSNGYQKFPNGLIIQWGFLNVTNDTAVTFPISFPTACYSVVATAYQTPATSRLIAMAVNSIGPSSFGITPRYVDNGGAVGVLTSAAASWIAIGK